MSKLLISDLVASIKNKVMSLFPISSDKIADKAITSAKIADRTIKAGNIANKAITTNEIQQNAITTEEILDGAVTNLKIANLSVDFSKLSWDVKRAAIKEWSGTIALTSDMTIVSNFDISNFAVGSFLIYIVNLNFGGSATSGDAVADLSYNGSIKGTSAITSPGNSSLTCVATFTKAANQNEILIRASATAGSGKFIRRINGVCFRQY